MQIKRKVVHGEVVNKKKKLEVVHYSADYGVVKDKKGNVKAWKPTNILSAKSYAE